jgi:hypothetical protein
MFHTWIILLILVIAIVAVVMFRGEPEKEKDQVVQAQETIDRVLGMKLEPAASTGTGLKVEGITKGGQAEQQDIKIGDRVIAVGDRSVWHTVQFTEFASEFSEARRPLPMLVESKGNYRLVVFGRPQGASPQNPPAAAAPPAQAPAEPGS